MSCHRERDDREAPTPVPVHCAAVGRQAVATTETLRGRIASPPGGDLAVASQVAGRIASVAVHEGDIITAGSVVATIDDSATRGALQQADAALAQAKSAAANADTTLDRTRQLVARGIAAKQELDDAVARTDQAHAAVRASSAAAELAQRSLSRALVRSALGGVITRVWRGPGALVDGTAATPVVQIAATTLAEFDADATERQLIEIAPGQQAQVVLASGAGPLVGTVIARSTALDPATGLGLVRIAVDANGPVLLGVFGYATVTAGQRQGVLVLPSVALRGAVSDGAQVVLCNGPAAELRTVELGWRDNARAEVRSGLVEGDRVAIDHVLGLEQGSPIVADGSAPTEGP